MLAHLGYAVHSRLCWSRPGTVCIDSYKTSPLATEESASDKTCLVILRYRLYLLAGIKPGCGVIDRPPFSCVLWQGCVQCGSASTVGKRLKEPRIGTATRGNSGAGPSGLFSKCSRRFDTINSSGRYSHGVSRDYFTAFSRRLSLPGNRGGRRG